MTKLVHYFTLLYYKMLIKGNYCAIVQLCNCALEINNPRCTFRGDSPSY